MKVFIDKKVQETIQEFYDNALSLHITLDESTVNRKIDRLYDAMYDMGKYAHIYPLARYKNDWIEKQYHEFIVEDFHFAFKIYRLSNGEDIVRIHDAVHSLLYHN